jgi:flagellar motor switch protein FliN
VANLLEQGKWILEEFSKGLNSPEAAWKLPDTPPVIVAEPTLRWKQPFSSLPQELWVLAEGFSSTEMLDAAFAHLGRAMSARLKRDVVPLSGEKTADNPPELRWASLTFPLANESVTLSLGVPGSIEDLFDAQPKTEGKTFDLLLDVELPVSVSFGRAQVALKDVLKLTTGSIVELNRAIVEPVDVVVNNCVIARGEVVVVEGNFGVRIQHVVSRGERLRSIQ